MQGAWQYQVIEQVLIGEGIDRGSASLEALQAKPNQ